MGLVAASEDELRALALKPEVVWQIIDTALSWHHDESEQTGGLQLAVIKDDVVVLSLWTGTDVFSGWPIRRDTLFPILSATKGLASMALLHLNHLGYFSWSDNISTYWPRFGRSGKGAATIEHLLSHRLGLPSLTANWTRWTDRSHLTGLVEEAVPDWEPGTRYGYHGGSWGIVVDELVRRWTDGSETGDVVSQALCAGAGASNCYLGLPGHRYKDVARLAYLEVEQRATSSPLGPIGPDCDYNSQPILLSCQSSGGAVSSAEDLARMYSLAARAGDVGGEVLWSSEAQAEATAAQNDPQREAPAARQTLQFAWGLGFMVSPSHSVYGTVPPSARVVGHPGASGAVGYADPDRRLSVGLTVNGVGGSRMYTRYRVLGDLVQAACLPES